MRAWGCLAGWVCGGVVVWLLAGCDSRPPDAAGTTTAQKAAPAAAPASAVDTANKYLKLVGRWQRTDAEYVVEVRSVDGATGRGEVAYFNPRPIHVSQAQASEEGGKLKLFVELDDEGYPGCNYRLSYFPATDQLFGVYYQAALEQSFDIEFERVR